MQKVLEMKSNTYVSSRNVIILTKNFSVISLDCTPKRFERANTFGHWEKFGAGNSIWVKSELGGGKWDLPPLPPPPNQFGHVETYPAWHISSSLSSDYMK